MKEPQQVDPSQFTQVGDYFLEDNAETATCKNMAGKAAEYLRQFSWCEHLEEAYVGFCYPGVIGAFLFRVVSSKPAVPPWVWVVTGDVPSTYFDGVDGPTPAAALRRYVDIMELWIDAVRGKAPFDDNVVTINVPPTNEFASLLEKRLDFLTREILPELDQAVGA